MKFKPQELRAEEDKPVHTRRHQPPQNELRSDSIQTTLQSIIAERVEILSAIDAAARLGHVPDGLIHALSQNHRAEAAEKRRQLTALERALDAQLRRIAAQFPEPAPVVEPTRSKVFMPLSHDLSGKVRAIRQ